MAKPRSPHPGMALPLLEPDPITPTRLRELREMALDRARGREYAAELSDDPDQANIEAEESLADQPTPLRQGVVKGAHLPYPSGIPQGRGRDMEVAQAASEEGGQTVEEAREQYESETEGLSRLRSRGDNYHAVAGYTEAFENILSSLPPEDQELLMGPAHGGGGHPQLRTRGGGYLGWNVERIEPSLFRPEIRRVIEQLQQLQAKTDDEGEIARGRWTERREFEEEFPEEGE